MKTRIANILLFVALWCIAIAEPLLACQSPVAEAAAENPRQISTDDLIITWSEKNDELRGYSVKLGTWDVLKVEPQEAIAPTGVSNLVVVRLGTSIAAFSAEKGWWDVIELPDATKVNVEIKNDRLVLVQTNEHLYAFVAEKGLWTSPTDPELKAATERVSGLEINRSKMDAFEAWRMTLPLYKQRGLNMRFTGGDVLVQTERQSWIKETCEKIAEIWGAADPLVKEPSTTLSGRTSEEIESQIAKLRADFSRLELAVQAGAGSASPLAADKENQARELRKLAEQSFDLRQQLHRLEAERMRLKLQLIEANLSAREKSREAIIARRLEELQSGDGEQSPASSQSQGAGAPIEGAPIGLSGPPQLSGGNQDGRGGLGSRNSNAAAVNLIANPVDRMQLQPAIEIRQNLQRFLESFGEWTRRQEHYQQEIKELSQPLQPLAGDKRSWEQQEERRLLRLKERQENLSSVNKDVADVLRDWNYAWSYYKAQLQLLRLDVDEAKSEADALASQHDRLAKLHSAGNVARESVDEVNVAFTATKINLQRTEQVLKLYADIEASEPELNPASVSPEWKPSTNAGNAASVPATAASVDPEPSQPPMDLPNSVQRSTSGRVALIGSWNEVQQIVEALMKCRSEYLNADSDSIEMRGIVDQLRTPVHDWKPADSDLFRTTISSLRMNPRFSETNLFRCNVKIVIEKHVQKYVDAGIMPRFEASPGNDSKVELKDLSDAMLEQIRVDWLALMEPILQRRESVQKKALLAWQELWNAYLARRQLLQLDVQEQKTRLEDSQQLKAVSTARNVADTAALQSTKSAVRLAEIQLQRAEATLKPYLDIETQHPELNPDYVAPEKPQPEPAVMP